MIRAVLLLALVSGLSWAQERGAGVTPAADAASSVSANAACLRCHGMSTLATRNADGTVRSLSVDSMLFADSNHGRLTCVRCHSGEGMLVYPHTETGTLPTSCLACHGGEEPILQEMRFWEIQAEFDSSVHAQCECPGMSSGFSCFTCHDPHVFRVWGDPSVATITSQNALCLGCHGDPDAFYGVVSRTPADLAIAHAWLPARENHWQHVRCLDCHTSYEPPNRSHFVMHKDRAVRDCEACHTGNTLLARKLYLQDDGTVGDRAGFLNAAVFNDSYVIGATRNTWLDLAGALMIGGALAGIVGHWLGRAIGRRRN